MFWMMLVGCPWVGDSTYGDRIRDVDGDGVESVRFGGVDCADDDPNITNCDQDQDGYLTAGADQRDCDDDDFSVHPEAPELCDGIDNDCDGRIDEQVAEVDLNAWYADADQDGYGTGSPTLACNAPAGFVDNAEDCNDGQANVNPAAPELCDGVDHNCDGEPRLNASDPQPWYEDLDGDGARGAEVARACTAPAGALSEAAPIDCDESDAAVRPGAVEIWYDDVDQDCDGGDDHDQDGDGASAPSGGGSDCDDTVAAIRPGADEVCDTIDNDCDGLIDDDDVLDVAPSFFLDADEDGYGTGTGAPASTCSPPAGFSLVHNDCDDDSPLTFPGADERCDGIDNDCDGTVDDNAIDGEVFYGDLDGDGHGSATNTLLACAPTSGYVLEGDDCNDAAASIHPGAVEICGDTIRQDCAEALPEDCDADGTVDTEDCGPEDPSIGPDAVEVCDGVDNDCDGLIDDADDDLSPVGAPLWYPDGDGDGIGAGLAVSACLAPAQHASRGDDCDDLDPNVNPLAPELCDGIDNDCDGGADALDPQGPTSTTWYPDADGDGFGTTPTLDTTTCAPPPNGSWSSQGGDCDDGISTTNPASSEICDGADNDCDGFVDNDATDAAPFFRDNDGDGHGSAALPVLACTAGPTISSLGDDCNDADPATYPGATEVCGDTIRQDCSTFDIHDCDSDGFVSVAAGGPDCDDTQAAVAPGALETCDGIDNDCDGALDDADPDVDLSTSTDWFLDDDGDGYGDPATSTPSCGQPAGYVFNASDCDDTRADVSPVANEACDGVDNDCDGLIDTAADGAPLDGAVLYYRDQDGDGFGHDLAAENVRSCVQPVGYEPVAGDCDDTNFAINPDANEVCDTYDNDCSGLADDNPTNGSTYYADADGDGFGTPSVTIQACTEPPGFLSIAMDCNDANPDVNPGAVEICYDGIRQDCLPAGLDDCDADGFDGNGGPDCDDLTAAVNPDASEICDGLDNDCDTLFDDQDSDVDLATTTDWLDDGDGDGFGSGPAESACSQPPGRVLASNGIDCDDVDPHTFPGADEICDGGDNDCDGAADDADPQGPVNPPTFYRDVDGDGHGDPAVDFMGCLPPLGNTWVTLADDCNDAAATAYPGAQETCDDLDNDCDTLIDDADASVQGQSTFQADADSDGYTNPSVTALACEPPPGFRLPNPAGDDCNDSLATANPGAAEICNAGIDDDCDGLVDNLDPDLTGNVEWYPDADGDNYGVTAGLTVQCTAPAGYVALGGDCNDTRPDLNPAATEVCDGQNLDEDCDGFVNDNDPSVEGTSTWYADGDSDGYGAGVGAPGCLAPPGFPTLQAGDCDDTHADVNPGEVEICDAGDVDEDCSGAADDGDPLVQGRPSWYVDADDDGHGNTALDRVDACDQPVGYASSLAAADCDDNNPNVSPSNVEVYYDAAGLDEDCNPSTATWDQDGDGDRADASIGGPGLDCDDSNPNINTTAAEILTDPGHVDENCDGFCNDADKDAWPPCTAPFTADCDDTDPSVNPGVVEVHYNSTDENCSGTADEWDQDGDGVLAEVPSWYTPQPSTPSSLHVDCDDTNPAVYPKGTVVVPDDAATLQAAIDIACDGDTIQMNASEADVAVTTRGRDLTLLGGPGIVLQGNASAPVVLVENTTLPPPFDNAPINISPYQRSTVEVHDLEITNSVPATSSTVSYGGGLLIPTGHQVIASNLYLHDLEAAQGGAIFMATDSTLTLTDSLFEHNTAFSEGGGLLVGFQSLDEISTNAPVVAITGVSFVENVAGGRGGAVAIGFGDFTAEDCTFEDNSGSGLSFNGFLELNGTLRNSTFSGSSPPLLRAGEDGITVITVEDSVFAGPARNIDTSADLFTLRRSIIGAGTDTGAQGAGMEIGGGFVELEDSVILGGRSERGGNLQLRGGATVTLDGMVIGDGRYRGYVPLETYQPPTGQDIYAEENQGNQPTITNTYFLDLASDEQAGLPGKYNAAANLKGMDNPVPDFLGEVSVDGNVYQHMPTMYRYDVSMPSFNWDLMVAGCFGDAFPANVGPANDPGTYCNDADNDGLPDGWETNAGARVGVSDLLPNADPDGDGLNNTIELAAGTHPFDPDTDRDGITDGEEYLQTAPCYGDPTSFDTDQDFLDDDRECNFYGTDPRDQDSDGDTLFDPIEINQSTDPNNPDTDGDGLTDAEESSDNETDALLPDTDGDGLGDLLDKRYCGNGDDVDGDGLPDRIEGVLDDAHHMSYNLCRDSAPDNDGDGLSNWDEIFVYYTNPLTSDTDQDGLDDSQEANNGFLGFHVDSDLDGIVDADEALAYSWVLDACDADFDDDGYPDGQEIHHNWDPTVASDPGTGQTEGDGDGDGMPDWAELMLTSFHFEPSDGTDRDGDGLLDGQEWNLGTRPDIADTDGDGLDDGSDPYPLQWYLPAAASAYIEETGSSPNVPTTCPYFP